MRLVRFEIKKLADHRTLIAGLFVILLINLVLLFIYTGSDSTGSREANRELTEVIKNMTLDEKKEYVRKQYETIRGLRKIDWYISYGVDPYNRDEYDQLISNYGKQYENGDYVLYTGSLQSEEEYYSSVLSEIETASGYSDYLKEIQKQAEIMESITVFSDPDSFEYKNIKKTAADYKSMEGKKLVLDYYPQKGFYMSVSFVFSDVLIIISMVLIAGTLITVEQDNGMLDLIKTNPRGHLGTAVAKFIALAVSTMVMTAVLYGINFAFCAVRYGLGPLNRSIQSTPFLIRSTMSLSLLEYTLIFIFAKWAASCAVGVLIMVITLKARKILTSMALTLTLYGANLVLFRFVRYNTPYSFIKYSNIAGILDVNTWLGSYYNFNVLGTPVSVRTVTIMFTAAMSIVSLFAFTVLYEHTYIKYSKEDNRIVILTAKEKHRRYTSILREEYYKTFIVRGAAVVLICLFVFKAWQGCAEKSYITSDGLFYKYYMEMLGGKYDKKRYEMILDEYNSSEMQSIQEAEDRYASGEMTSNEHDGFRQINLGSYMKKEALDRIVAVKISKASRDPDCWIVYEYGYRELFDNEENEDIRDILLCSLVIAVVLSGIWSFEDECGMTPLLLVTPLGRKKLISSKITVAVIVGIITAVCCILASYIHVVRDFGLQEVLAPLRSLDEYQDVSKHFRIIHACIMNGLLKITACVYMAIVMLYLSKTVGNTLSAFFIGAAILCVPDAVALAGLKRAQYYSLYELFHFPHALTTKYGIVYLISEILFVAVTGYFMVQELYKGKED